MPSRTFATGLNQPTDLKAGPDGGLYAVEHGSTDTDGAVVRFSPASAVGNPTPTPTPTPTPSPTADLVGAVQSVPVAAVEGGRAAAVVRVVNAGGAPRRAGSACNYICRPTPASTARTCRWRRWAG